MSQVRIMEQTTPNPNALKYILDRPVKLEGKATYEAQAECEHVVLAYDLLGLAHISSIHLFQNSITVTQDGEADWDHLSWLIKAVIETRMPIHNADFEEKVIKAKPKPKDPEIEKIDAILDRTIRQGLQMDGGDVEILSLKDKVITIQYMGACGTCPSSTMGTLHALTSILREEYDPEIYVQIA